MKQFYTYLHCYQDGNPFYVGKGSGRRAWNFSNRNIHHNNIVSKCGGSKNIKVFVFMCETEKQSFEDEVHQIYQLKKEGYKLCNMSNGGEGTSGFKMTMQTRSLIKKRANSKESIERSYWMFTGFKYQKEVQDFCELSEILFDENRIINELDISLDN